MRVVTLFDLGFRAIKAQACDVKHGFRKSEIVFCELKSLTLDQLGGEGEIGDILRLMMGIEEILVKQGLDYE